MPKLTKVFCAEQIQRLSALPYYTALDQTGFDSLWQALQATAETEAMAEKAISALLADTCRAANPDLNRVPSPGEIRVWVHQQKDRDGRYWRGMEKPDYCLRCGGSGMQGILGLTIEEIESHPTGGMEQCEMCQQ